MYLKYSTISTQSVVLIINNKLKQLREKNNISRMKLAAKLSINVRHLAFIEDGERKPSIELAYKIAQYFNKTIEEIFF